MRFLGCIISLAVVTVFILGFTLLVMSTPIGFVMLILGVAALIFLGLGFGVNLFRQRLNQRKR